MIDIAKALDIIIEISAGIPKEDAFRDIITSVAANTAKIFNVKDDEVAILLLKKNDPLLRFAYPLELYRGKTNFFPINAPSIAATCFQAKAGRIYNDLSKTTYLSIYEMISGEAGKYREIQKLIAAPIMYPSGKVIGVIEVSEKGKTLQEAGADFCEKDLETLIEIGKTIAPYLEKTIPEDF